VLCGRLDRLYHYVDVDGADVQLAAEQSERVDGVFVADVELVCADECGRDY